MLLHKVSALTLGTAQALLYPATHPSLVPCILLASSNPVLSRLRCASSEMTAVLPLKSYRLVVAMFPYTSAPLPQCAR